MQKWKYVRLEFRVKDEKQWVLLHELGLEGRELVDVATVFEPAK